ncbi:hypothetical protein HDU76_003335 [Blyttiomyces sp. JEL0837]|nr:hypothetical protein HDU76_003335 [Blyttiomyces sp. JEL0837]
MSQSQSAPHSPPQDSVQQLPPTLALNPQTSAVVSTTVSAADGQNNAQRRSGRAHKLPSKLDTSNVVVQSSQRKSPSKKISPITPLTSGSGGPSNSAGPAVSEDPLHKVLKTGQTRVAKSQPFKITVKPKTSAKGKERAEPMEEMKDSQPISVSVPAAKESTTVEAPTPKPKATIHKTKNGGVGKKPSAGGKGTTNQSTNGKKLAKSSTAKPKAKTMAPQQQPVQSVASTAAPSVQSKPKPLLNLHFEPVGGARAPKRDEPFDKSKLEFICDNDPLYDDDIDMDDYEELRKGFSPCGWCPSCKAEAERVILAGKE